MNDRRKQLPEFWQFPEWLPEGERARGHACTLNLHSLRAAIDNFKCALTLADYLDDANRPRAATEHPWWTDVAVRDAVLQVFHVARAHDGLRTNLGGKSPILPELDRKALKGVWKHFLERFPDWQSLRNAVAHQADLTHSPIDFESHCLKGAGATLFSSGTFTFGSVPRHFSTTYQGRTVSLEITQSSLDALEMVWTETLALFEGALRAAYARRIGELILSLDPPPTKPS